MCLAIFITCESACLIMFSLSRISLCVCLSVCHARTFESLDLSSFWHAGIDLENIKVKFVIKAIGSRLKSCLCIL